MQLKLKEHTLNNLINLDTYPVKDVLKQLLKDKTTKKYHLNLIKEK